ncbi:MAG: hypothetical protein Wins2KO_31870 [Winogradskyella sp.]
MDNSLKCGCVDGLSNISENLTRPKKRWVTIPKRNADFRAKPKGLCIFTKSLNLMDLALDKKK